MAAEGKTDWRALCATAPWTPLREIGPYVVTVAPRLFRVGSQAYVLAQPKTRSFQTGHPDAPFVTKVYWAPSDGAARRAALLDVDADDGAIGVMPPAIVSIGGSATYAALIGIGKDCPGIGVDREHATYAADGRFVHKVVAVGLCEFYFRSPEIETREVPYAMGRVLSAK